MVLWIFMYTPDITVNMRMITTPLIRWVTAMRAATWPTLTRQLYGYTIRPRDLTVSGVTHTSTLRREVCRVKCEE